MNAITEWAALPATEMFLRDNRDDSDFCAFMSIWFYEEQKHALALMEYLRRFRPDLLPTEEELHAVRFEFDPAPPPETLMLHFCGEMRLNHWYRCAAQWHTEPVIRKIYDLISRDEARHAGAYLKFMKRAIERGGDEVRRAFAKIGVLMASAGTRGQAAASHQPARQRARCFPTTPCKAGCPIPAWLTRWLDEQIRFDGAWEQRVIGMILTNLSLLFGCTFESVQDLNRYRRTLGSPDGRAVSLAAMWVAVYFAVLVAIGLVAYGSWAAYAIGARRAALAVRRRAALRLPRVPAVLHEPLGAARLVVALAASGRHRA